MTSQPSQRPVGALRARMIEDMRVRGFTEKTRNDYIRNVRSFAAFIGRSPGGSAPFPAAPDADRHAAAERQQCSGGAALLLHGDARPSARRHATVISGGAHHKYKCVNETAHAANL